MPFGIMTRQKRVISKKAILCLFLTVSFLLSGLYDISEPWKPLNISVAVLEGMEVDNKGIHICFKPIFDRTQGGDAVGVRQHSYASVNREEIDFQAPLICLISLLDRAPPSLVSVQTT